MRLLDRHLLAHLAVPFVIGLLLFVLILLGEVAYHIGSTIAGGRVSAGLILKYLLLRTPRAIVWSLPFGALLGSSMAISNLAYHGELTAMRSGGVSIPRICAAAIVLGALAGGLGIALNRVVVPRTMVGAQSALTEMMQSQPVVDEAYNQFFRDKTGRFFYVREMLPAQNLLRGVTIWERDDKQRVRVITTAGSAGMSGRTWSLRDGVTVHLDERGEIVGGTENFSSKTILLSQALQNYYADQRTPAEMAPHELQELVRVRRQTGASTGQLEVYLQFKYSIPAACLVFVLIAAPLAFRYARYGTYAGVVLAIVIVFLYNGVRSWTLAFGLAGTLPPIVAGWMPDLLFGVVGLVLLARER